MRNRFLSCLTSITMTMAVGAIGADTTEKGKQDAMKFDTQATDQGKQWTSLMNGLTKVNLKKAVIKDMYANYRSFSGERMDVIQDFITLKSTFHHSKSELQINDWHNERMFADISFNDGNEVCLHLGYTSLNIDDLERLGITLPKDKDKLEEKRPTTLGYLRQYSSIYPGELERLQKSSKFKDLKDDDIVLVCLPAGYMTVNKGEKLYFAMDGGMKDLNLLLSPLYESEKTQGE